MEYLYLIGGGVVGFVGFALIAVNRDNREAAYWRKRAIDAEAKQKEHERECRRIGKMGKRQGAITGANA